MAKRCRNCAFYRAQTGDNPPTKVEYGFCFVNPPEGSQWPIVRSDDTCGDYVEANPAEIASPIPA